MCLSVIEDDYVGPKLEDDKVTLQFMEDLMDYYKNQKKLHKKYAYKVSRTHYIPFISSHSNIDPTDSL